MTKLTVWAASVMLVTGAAAQPPTGTTVPENPNLFSSEDRDAVIQFWSTPDRYTISEPDDAAQKGLWQVRLTTAGSTWLLSYNRKRNLNVPPGQVPKPQTTEQTEWEKWVVAKLNHDRWEAWQLARAANRTTLNIDAPVADKTIPTAEPESPGPIPPALLGLVGNPPKFAEAVVPMQHTIAFDDITLKYRDNVRVSSPRYAYYRFAKGVNSEGVSMARMTQEQIDNLFETARVSERDSHILRAVSELEGGFDAVNTYDTGYVSVGFIQFASLKDGGESLGGLLAQYKKDDPTHFNQDLHRFGIDVTDTRVLDIVDPSTGAELTGNAATMKIVEDPRLVAVFQRAGLKSEAFNAAQIRSAKAQFWPEQDALTVKLNDGSTLTGRVSDFVRSEAGLATLLDRKVNTGHIDILTNVLARMAPDVHPRTMADYAPYEREIIQAVKYRKDYLADASLQQPGDSAARRPERVATNPRPVVNTVPTQTPVTTTQTPPVAKTPVVTTPTPTRGPAHVVPPQASRGRAVRHGPHKDKDRG